MKTISVEEFEKHKAISDKLDALGIKMFPPVPYKTIKRLTEYRIKNTGYQGYSKINWRSLLK